MAAKKYFKGDGRDWSEGIRDEGQLTIAAYAGSKFLSSTFALGLFPPEDRAPRSTAGAELSIYAIPTPRFSNISGLPINIKNEIHARGSRSLSSSSSVHLGRCKAGILQIQDGDDDGARRQVTEYRIGAS